MVTGLNTTILLDARAHTDLRGPCFPSRRLGAHRLREDLEIPGFVAGMNRKLEERAGQIHGLHNQSHFA
jgi:hypothetical protein